MQRRAWRLLAVLLAFTMIAAACGSDGDEASDGDDGSADAADTGGDGGADDNGGDDGAEDTGADAADTGGDDGADDRDGDTGGAGEAYVDPRGEPFVSFQQQFDRTHPFQSLDRFCVEPEAMDTDTSPIDSDHPGITADEITIVHLRSRLEQLEALGLGTDVGDPIEMFEVFTQIVNEECGGIHGRQINLELVEVDVFVAGADLDALRNTACIEATEDKNAVIVINSTGFQGTASLCLVEDHDAIFLSTQGQPQDFVDRGNGRLVTMGPTLEESLAYLADVVLASGELDGKTVAVVSPDTPGQLDAVESLADTLEDAGVNVAVFGVVGCGGTSSCSDGLPGVVSDMRAQGVDVVFPTLNTLSFPAFVTEMVSQGFSPGDVQFYNSDFNSQAGDSVSSNVVRFGGEDAGNLYNGALIVDEADTGGFRLDGYETPLFNQLCNDELVRGGGAAYDVFNVDQVGFGMTTSVCALYRIALRALYDAGPNPSFQDVVDALSMGPVDVNHMIPSHLTDDHRSAPSAVHRQTFNYPCPTELPGYAGQDTCMLSVEDDQWVYVREGVQ